MSEPAPRLAEEPLPAWAGLPAARRRLTLDDIRARCARLGPPERRSMIVEVDAPRPAALLVPVTEMDGEAAVIVTRRPPTMLHHRDDWVFPGGRLDPSRDRSARDAAIRETAEELGAPMDRIEVVGRLATHGPIVTGFVIDVFVGLVRLEDIAPDPTEVAEWVVLPISVLTEPGVYRRSQDMPAHVTGPTVAELPSRRGAGGLRFFAVRDGEELWGTQGEVLHELLEWLFREAGAGFEGE